MPLPILFCAPLAIYTTAAVPPLGFDAMRFFSGATAGSGQIKVLLQGSEDVRVHGRGYVAPDGTLVLDQQVALGKHPPTQRVWQLREIAPGRYRGTLSDARGPVTGESIGSYLHLSYRAKRGVRINQWLILAEDGRSAQNTLVAKMMGVEVARLQETIRKMD